MNVPPSPMKVHGAQNLFILTRIPVTGKKKRVIHDNPKWIQLNYIYKQIQSNYNYKQITKSKQGHFTGTYILGSGGHSSTHNSIQFDA